MKECPNCATDISDSAEICPICKYDFPSRPTPHWKPAAALILIALLFPLVWKLVRSLAQ